MNISIFQIRNKSQVGKISEESILEMQCDLKYFKIIKVICSYN